MRQPRARRDGSLDRLVGAPASERAMGGGMAHGSYVGFKSAVAVIAFHFGVKIMVQFADILLPFIMALLLVTVLDPVKQETYVVLECTMVLFFQNVSCLGCCLRPSRRSSSTASDRQSRSKGLREWVEKLLLLVSIAITVLLAGRLFWIVGRIVWLSGEAITVDFEYYKRGVEKRGEQAQALLRKYHLDKKASLDTEDLSNMALQMLRYVAEFFTQHVFYTITQVSLTTIFVLFLLYSPVQREAAPVMQGVFSSMELYLKLKTFISFLMAVTNSIALAYIGLELPAAWGLLTFLSNFIPNVGGPTVSILPCLIALMDIRKSTSQVLWAFLAQFFLHFNIANFVEPIVFGTTEEIHSVVVLLGLSFFGYIWGFTGMFLSVPLLFAIHAWLDIVARTPSYPTEARDDARFIMGILEGRWLADSQGDNDDETGGVSALTGHIEGAESESMPGAKRGRSASPAPRGGGPGGLGEGGEGAPGLFPSAASGEAPINQWAVTSRLREIWEVRDPDTDEVLLPGLLLRCAVLGGAYVMVFFGFSIFNWDLGNLIHPSGTSGHEIPLHVGDKGTTTAANSVTTTAAATTWAIPTTVAAFTSSAASAATQALAHLHDGGTEGPTGGRGQHHGSDSVHPSGSHRQEEGDAGDVRPVAPAPGGHGSSVAYVDDLGGPDGAYAADRNGTESKRRHKHDSGKEFGDADVLPDSASLET